MKNILQYVLAISIIVVGIDKFLLFLPECSLSQVSSASQLMVVGVIEIILGILLLFDKKTVIILYITAALMIFAILAHLKIGTTDISFAVIGLISSVALLFLTRNMADVR